MPASLLGLDDAPVRAIAVEDVAMWVSDAPTSPRERSIERIQRHNDVVNMALGTGPTPLPMRFGQRFESEDEARRYLVESLVRLRPLFARFVGKVEMAALVAPALKKTLRDLQPVTPAALDPAKRGAGHRYLEQIRRESMRERHALSVVEPLLDRICDVVKPIVLAEERKTQHPGIGAVAHLVLNDDVPRYRQLVQSLNDDESWQFLVTGPRAPYTFCVVEDEEGAGGTFLAT